VWKRVVLGLCLATGILLVLVSRLDAAGVWRALAGVRWELLALAAGIQAGILWLKAERWSLSIAAGQGLRPRKRAFAAIVIGNAGNLVLPARLGDMVRALVLRRHNAVSASQALVAGWSVALLDLLAVAAVVLLSGSSLVSPKALGGLATAGILMLGIMALLHRRPEWAERVEEALFPGPRTARLRGLLQRSREGFRFLGHGRSLLGVAALTAAIWVCEVASMTSALRAYDIRLGAMPAALLVGAAGLSFVVPLTPGSVGVFQALCILVLGAFDVPRERAFAFGLGAQTFSLVLSVIWGLALVQREGLSLASLRREASDVLPGA
jgi:uncharacterized protein (TIRG00374 family)